MRLAIDLKFGLGVCVYVVCGFFNVCVQMHTCLECCRGRKVIWNLGKDGLLTDDINPSWLVYVCVCVQVCVLSAHLLYTSDLILTPDHIHLLYLLFMCVFA